MRIWPIVIAVALVVAALWWLTQPAHSQASSDAANVAGQHSAVSPAEMKWGAPPPVFRPGARMTVLYGEPMKEGALYILMLKVPAGYRIMPHWHPRDENVTVLSGSLAIGMGDTFDPNAKPLPTGSFFSMPAGMHHFAFMPTETTVQVSGIGPFKLTYVHPEDDPQKRATR